MMIYQTLFNSIITFSLNYIIPKLNDIITMDIEDGFLEEHFHYTINIQDYYSTQEELDRIV